MFLYLIDYWIPFPECEYGGMVCVTAKDDDDCAKVLFEAYEDEENGCWYGMVGGHKEEIKENIKSAQRYKLEGEFKSEIVKEFTT